MRILISLKSLPASIWAIGIAHMLINTSSIVIYSLTPTYLTQVLLISISNVGMQEGIIEATAWSSRLLSGILSDRLKKRKIFLLSAYILTALSRPIFSISNHYYWFLFGRSIDRIGNGLQATPREALIADLTPNYLRGTSFGLRLTLSIFGSTVGAILLIIWIEYIGINYNLIFLLMSIPPIFAVFIVLSLVKDSPISKNNTISVGILRNLQVLLLYYPKYWLIIFLSAFYMLSNYSGSFMILRANDFYNSPSVGPIVMLCQNLLGTLAAFPIGFLSDRGYRLQYLYIGFIAAITANLFLSYGTSFNIILIGAGIWGIQMAICQSIFSAAIADCSSIEVRGTAFGIYYLLVACMLFLSNKFTGWIYEFYGSSYAFNFSSIFILISILILTLMLFLQNRNYRIS